MKRFLSFAMAAVLLMVGCAKDNDSLNVGDQTVAVTFSAQLPIEVSRTVGDGSQATVLSYAIYSEAGELFANYPYEENIEVRGNVATLTLDLVKGQKYKIAFWAQNAAAPYTFDRVAKTVTVAYDAQEKSNDEIYDAFYALEPVEVKGPFQKTVTLRRPFAQINLGATKDDVKKAKALGVEIDKSQVTFTDVPTVLNLVDGTLGEETTNVDVTFTYNALPAQELEVKGEKYAYIAANYILADTESNVTDVTFSIKQGDKVINENVTVPAVSYKRNYRTNILGRLLTSSVDFNIVIDGTPTGDLELSKEAELILAMQTEGEYTLTEDLTLSKPLVIEEGVTFTLDLNGKTLSVESGNAIKNNGTLILKGDVVTRASGVSSVISKTTYGVNNSGILVVDGVKVNAIFNAGELTFNDGIIENTISGKHGIYHCGSKMTINAGQFSSTSGNELIHATQANTTTINGGTFTQIGKSYLFGSGSAAIVINDGTFNGYVNDNGTNDKMRPGSAVVYGGTFNFDASAWVADDYKAMESNGKWVVVEADVDAVASTDAELADAVQNGAQTVVVPAGTYTFPDTFTTGVTLECAEGVVFNAAADPSGYLNINGATVVGATFKGSNESGANLAKGTVNGTFKDCTFEGYNTLRYCYAGTDEVVFEGCTFKGQEYAVHFDSGTNKTLKFKDCKFYGTFTNGVGFTVIVENCEFYKDLRGKFNIPNFYDKSTVIDSKFMFDGTATVEVVRLWYATEDATKHVFTNCTVNGAPLKDNTSYLLQKLDEGDKLTIDGEVYVYEGGVLDTQSWYQDAQGVYHIIKGKGLANMSANYFAQGGKFVLDNNIDMAGIAFAPFCQATLGQGFLEFDGNGKKISNLTVTGDYAALFGQLFNFYIHDLTIEASTTSGTYAAAILGYTDNTGDGSYTKKIERCNVVDCTVGSGKYVGGVVGYSSSNTAEIANCIVSESDIVSKYSEDGGATYKGHCGGIIGGCYGGSVASCSVVDNTFDVLGDRTGLVVGSAWGGTFSATTVNGNTGLDRNCGLTVANGTWN